MSTGISGWPPAVKVLLWLVMVAIFTLVMYVYGFEIVLEDRWPWQDQYTLADLPPGYTIMTNRLGRYRSVNDQGHSNPWSCATLHRAVSECVERERDHRRSRLANQWHRMEE